MARKQPPKPVTCQCGDRLCSAKHAGSQVCAFEATCQLYRVDMEDEWGTPYCRPCADDALESGLFREGPLV